MRAARWRPGRVRGGAKAMWSARARCSATALGRIRAAAAVCLRACVHASSLLGCLRRSDSGDWDGDNTEQMELHVATRGFFRECFFSQRFLIIWILKK